MYRVALIVTQQVRKSRSIHSSFDKFRVLFLFGSLAEFMGPFWFGQVSKSMVERDFNRFERPEAIGFSEGQFQTVVETLNDTAGNSLFGPKPVQQQRPVLAQHASHFLHRLDARAQGARTPAIQELPRPGGRTIVPEELEVLLEQVGADGL